MRRLGLMAMVVLCLSLFINLAMADNASSDTPMPEGITPLIDAEPPKTTAQPPPSDQPPETVMQDIHDIKPPVPAPPAITWLLYLIAGALGMGLLIFLYLLWRKRRQKLKSDAVSAIPPEEAAMTALNGFGPLDTVDGQAFYFRLSGIIRRYMASRFGVNAPEMTTEELLPRLEVIGIPRELTRELRELFQSGDMIKYAKGETIVSRMEKDLGFARKFIKQTTPTPDDAPSDSPEIATKTEAPATP